MTGGGLESGDTGTIVDRRIVELAAAIREDWGAIDTAWDAVRRRRRDIHLRRDAGLDEKEFLCQALATAQALNLMRTFAAELYRQDLVGEKFDTALSAILTSSYELQAFQNGTFLPVHAYQYGRGLIDACSQVCRISIRGDDPESWQHSGTGVLIRPTLVATAAHVIWPLVEQRADGSLQAKPDSVGRITLTFGDFLDFVEEDKKQSIPHAAYVAQLHADWLAWGSAPTPRERSSAVFDILSIDNITAESGPWDVALLRLAGQVPDSHPSGILATSVTANPLAVQLLHHPISGAKQPLSLLLSTGEVDRQLGAPPVRFLHTANTLQGSSGAPVYDDKWRVVALHQAGQRELQNVSDANQLARSARNRAVPVHRWLPQLDAVERVLDTVPYIDTLSDDPENVPFPYPVVGRHQTQQAVHAALDRNASIERRLLILRGPVGSGRRFSRRLIGQRVGKEGHLFRALDLANLAGLDSTTIAERIMLKVTETSTSLSPSGTTTGRRDLRDIVVPAMIEQFSRVGGGQQIWLHLDGLAPPLGEMSPSVSDLLSGLVERLGTMRRLRLVLVGWPDKPPTGFESSVEDLAPPTADDVISYLYPAGDQVDPKALFSIQAEMHRLETQQEPLIGYPAAVQVIEVMKSRIASGGSKSP